MIAGANVKLNKVINVPFFTLPTTLHTQHSGMGRKRDFTAQCMGHLYLNISRSQKATFCRNHCIRQRMRQLTRRREDSHLTESEDRRLPGDLNDDESTWNRCTTSDTHGQPPSYVARHFGTGLVVGHVEPNLREAVANLDGEVVKSFLCGRK